MSAATETLLALANYNSWRRGDETLEMPSPAEIGATIDDAVNLLREYDELERRAERAEAELAKAKAIISSIEEDGTAEHNAAVRLRQELASEREKMMVLKLDKDRLDWWNGEPYYQFGKSHKCMNPGWWWSCGFESGMHGKYGIKNIRDAIDSAMAHSKSGRNKYNVCKRIEQSSTEDKP